MLIESAIANIEQLDSPPDNIDWLDLTWLECRTRFARKLTRGGTEVRILLRLRQVLTHGDIVGQSTDGQTVVVNLLHADVLVIRSQGPHSLIEAAFQIGNLHLPMQLAADHLLVPCGSEVEAMLAKNKIGFEIQTRRFQPTHWPDSVSLSPSFQVVRRRAKGLVRDL